MVGDFDPAELEACVLKYLGTVSPEPKVSLPEDAAERLGRPLQILGGMPLEQRHMTWHLKDSGGCPAPPRACRVGAPPEGKARRLAGLAQRGRGGPAPSGGQPALPVRRHRRTARWADCRWPLPC